MNVTTTSYGRSCGEIASGLKQVTSIVYKTILWLKNDQFENLFGKCVWSIGLYSVKVMRGNL